MKIEKIEIHNWRSIKQTEIYFQDLMVFIGQNNHGKSNILSAILFFFGEINFSDSDFNVNSNELYVEIIFKDLDSNDEITFQKYVTNDGCIKVRKTAKKGGGSEYHGYCEVPEPDWLREENAGKYTKRNDANLTPLKDFLPLSGHLKKENIIEAQNNYIKNNRESIVFSYFLEENNFLGFKSVAQGIFGNIFFIPAVKGVDEELNVKGKTAFSRLFNKVINEMSSDNQFYKEAKEKIVELSAKLNKNKDGSVNVNRPQQIANLEKKIEEELEKWNTKIDIEILPPNMDEIFKLGTFVYVDDGVSTDVNRKGNGLQRALIFALIKSWANIELEEKINNREQRRSSSLSNYFIFEEPELYLHPQAQREMYSSLKTLSSSGNQMLISTHSSSFINLKEYKTICIVYKNSVEEGTKSVQCLNELFTSSDEKKNFNLIYWINPDRGELFFAKKVILVEGATDKTVLSYLADKIKVFRYDYTIIDCGSKDNIKNYINLLNKFRISYVAVYDKDNQPGKNEQALNVANKSSVDIENIIDSSIGKSVIFENDIEDEIGLTKKIENGKAYIGLKKVSEDSFVLSSSFKEKIEEIFN